MIFFSWLNSNWWNLFKNLDNTTSDKSSIKFTNLYKSPIFSKECCQVRYKVIKHKRNHNTKTKNQYCHLNIAYYNLSTAPKTSKPCSQLCQYYTGEDIRFGWIQEVTEKQTEDGCRQRSIRMHDFFKAYYRTEKCDLDLSLKWAITVDFLS